MKPTLHTRLLASTLTATLAVGLAVPAQAEQRELHVYNWSDYIAEDTLANFEAKTGIRVIYDVFDSNEVLEAKLLSGRSGYDIVVPSNNFLAKQIRAGIFQEMDREQLPNWKNLDFNLLNTLDSADPGNRHAIPYLWGTTGIGYNVDKVKAALGIDRITSWDVVFNPDNLAKLKECGVSMLDTPAEIYPAALNYLGEPPVPTHAEDIAKAEEALMAIRPYVRYFHSSKYITDLANGDICLAIGWSGDVMQAKSRAQEVNNGVNIAYSIPNEGAGTFFDMLAIPADAKNVDEAYAFINYLMEPQVIAAVTDYVAYPNGNAAATEYVEEAIRTDPGIYPSEAVRAKLYTFGDLNPKVIRAMTRSWTRVKSGQ